MYRVVLRNTPPARSQDRRKVSSTPVSFSTGVRRGLVFRGLPPSDLRSSGGVRGDVLKLGRTGEKGVDTSPRRRGLHGRSLPCVPTLRHGSFTVPSNKILSQKDRGLGWDGVRVRRHVPDYQVRSEVPSPHPFPFPTPDLLLSPKDVLRS